MYKKRCLYFALSVIIAAGIMVMLVGHVKGRSAAPNQTTYKIPQHSERALQTAMIHLYFADQHNTYLSAENRAMILPDDPSEKGRRIINALIEGPRGGLIRTIPEQTALRSFFLTEDGTAYVDFDNAVRENHPGGCESELMSIYSIVNSLILNIDQIHSIKILIEGKEALTLSGHMDLRFPFNANMLMVR